MSTHTKNKCKTCGVGTNLAPTMVYGKPVGHLCENCEAILRASLANEPGVRLAYQQWAGVVPPPSSDETFFEFMDGWCCLIDGLPDSAALNTAMEGVHAFNIEYGACRPKLEWAKKYLRRRGTGNT